MLDPVEARLEIIFWRRGPDDPSNINVSKSAISVLYVLRQVQEYGTEFLGNT